MGETAEILLAKARIHKAAAEASRKLAGLHEETAQLHVRLADIIRAEERIVEPDNA